MSEYHEFVAGLFALAGLTEIPSQRRWWCHECELTFDILQDLNDHWKTTHPPNGKAA